MQNTKSKTSKQGFNRVAEVCLRWFNEKLHRAPLAAGWAGVFLLLLSGSFTAALAQAVSNPNQIYGTISWNNNPLSPVYAYLNSPLHGLGGGTITARDVGGLFTASTGVADDPSDMSAPYSIDVQAGVISGIQHNVSPQMFTEDANTYWFETALSGGVIFPPAVPDVLLDFTECAGLVEVQFCNPAGSPVAVSSGFVSADVQPSGARQAEGHFANVSSKRLAVRGGNTFNVVVSITVTSGTDVFSDYFSITYTTNYTVTVGCDQIVTNKFIVPPSPIGSGGGSLGKIIGIADVLGKNEHWINQGRTIVNAFDGPFANYRYDNIEPLSQPGYLPCSVASPQVGTPSCNSAGPYSLINLLPSNFSTPPRDYGVVPSFYFDLYRRYEFFVPPYLRGVTVPSAGTVDLGNTFVIHPGYVVGDIFFCGPPEGTNADSHLRHIYRADAEDTDGDGIPNSLVLDGSSSLRARGLNLLGAGAAHTADGGEARVLFEGDFVASGPDKNHFVGDYNMTLGGLLGETTLWDQRSLLLIFGNVSTPVDRDSYINSLLEINNLHFANVEIVPTKTIPNNHRYGLSQVCISFHATSGTLFGPVVSGGGNFNGINFEGEPAQYSGVVHYGFGTPTSLATATPDGQVVLCIPEGTYTFNPTVESVNPGGTSSSHNTLLPFTLVVPPCTKIRVTPEIQMTLTNLPTCATNRTLHVTGSIASGTNVATIYYELNGGAPVTVCNNCGISQPFAFNVLLADCENTLKVTAIDANGRRTSIDSTIDYDITPPVLSGCTNISTNSLAGTNGNFVNYPVTALDNCDGPLPVTCVPPPGSFFPNGQTVVTCTAVDHCGNTNTCQFTVSILNPCVPLTNDCALHIDRDGVERPGGVVLRWGGGCQLQAAASLENPAWVNVAGSSPLLVPAPLVPSGSPSDPSAGKRFFRTISANGSCSLNIVGYLNLTLPAGQQCLIANPFNGTNNLLNTILPLPTSADGTVINRFDPATQTLSDPVTWIDGLDWTAPDFSPSTVPMPPGEGFFITIQGTETITFVGEVPQGNLLNPLPAGFSYQSSMADLDGQVSGVPFLGLPGGDGDRILIFDPATQQYKDVYTYVAGSGWSSSNADDAGPDGPIIRMGTGFIFQNAGAAKMWAQNFLLSDCAIPSCLTCATNKTVECGRAWTFDPPDASACCGTNIMITVINTVTNGTCPQVITRTWQAVDCCNNTNTCRQTVAVVDTVSVGTCVQITNEVITCLTNGKYTYTFAVTNFFSGPIAHLVFLDLPAGMTVTPGPIITLPTVLAPGQGTTVTVTIDYAGAAPTNLCFRISAHNENFVECCVVDRCITLEECCAAITRQRITQTGSNTYRYEFCYQNLSPDPVSYLFLVPDPAVGSCFSFNPNVIVLGPGSPYGPVIPPGGTRCFTGAQGITITASPGCGPRVCFLLSAHDVDFNKCCSIRQCIRLRRIVFDRPTEGEVFTAPVNVPVGVSFDADTPIGEITQVQFALGTNFVATDAQSPFATTLNGLAPGTYALTAEAADTSGLVSVSSPVSFTVNPATGSLPRLGHASLKNGAVSFSMATMSGITSHIEYTDSLSLPNWQVLKTISGDGSVMTVTDSVTNAPQRFYRVRTQ